MKKNHIELNALPHLKVLFNLFCGGAHLNRWANASLWHGLELHREQYQAVFKSLGFELEIDNRGFAWFHDDEGSSNITKQSRQLALLLMVIFDYQADCGRSLGAFHQWIIDRELLFSVHEKHKGLLDAEELDQDGLVKILELAVRKGFATQENNHWQLLSSVYRYLDHFEAISENAMENAVSKNEESEPC